MDYAALLDYLRHPPPRALRLPLNEHTAADTDAAAGTDWQLPASLPDFEHVREWVMTLLFLLPPRQRQIAILSAFEMLLPAWFDGVDSDPAAASDFFAALVADLRATVIDDEDAARTRLPVHSDELRNFADRMTRAASGQPPPAPIALAMLIAIEAPRAAYFVEYDSQRAHRQFIAYAIEWLTQAKPDGWEPARGAIYRTQFAREWWSRVRARLAFADATTADLTA